MHDVFISYSRRNARFVNRLAADLADHGLDIWLDTVELEVGTSVHKTIEEGIKGSRFFCLAMSPAALDSYYVREIEYEQAFSRMVIDRRESYILPIVIQRLDRPVPDRIAHLYRLDFVNRKNYNKNVKQLVDKVRGTGRDFTGSRWFKGLNISNLGQPVGVGPTTQKASLGASYCMHWDAGIVTRVDVYDNGALAHYKEFDYDKLGRVVANKMYSPDGVGGWAITEDVWYYTYDAHTGSRATKTMRYPGEATARIVHYDDMGRPTSEDIVTDAGKSPDRDYGYSRKAFSYDKDGKSPDRDYGYSRKAFSYDKDGNPTGEAWFDAAGHEIPVAKGAR